jgi:phage terminase large subunit-like protein
VIDELAAIQNRDIYDLVKQGMQARSQPLLFTISTNGFVRECIFDAQYKYATDWLDDTLSEPNDRFIAFIYELDDRAEWDKEECWIKANPSLGIVKSLDFLRGSVAKAKDDPAYKPTVMAKDFNLVENAATAWLNWSDIENTEAYDFGEMKFRYGIGYFDAADSVDLNAAGVLCQRRLADGTVDPKIYVRSMFWLPESVLEEDARSGSRRERDNVPYSLWERRGLLRSWPGNKVSKRCFLDWFRELKYEEDLWIYKVGLDPWHIDDSLLAEFEAEFGKQSIVKVRQGAATMSQPLKELRADLQAKKIVHGSNPLLMWNMSNAEVKADINGNIQLVKGLDQRKRIDGLVGLACGYIVLKDNESDYHAII